ncbi:hypothetical protein BCR44DRAFT_119145 [Catenaria anguillulae PL171]|uniref:NADH:flavin oxidoreductase/NADH oxidase N-terminal domain-containing protein n=1 Tax=Catenaria anguillulae PL171 TaxID=765915 RepID=A0A1Y2HZR6_9FUNG|nr:hypothetical protein BCR44DRAFT_119145 [Catenaria anguillulae PL171]
MTIPSSNGSAKGSADPRSFFITQKVTPGSGTPKSGSQSSEVAALFRPIQVRGVVFPNRIQVSPMCMYSAQDGFATDFHLVHVGQFALRGVGMTVMEATAVLPEGRISPRDLGIWSDNHIAPLRRITDFIHHHKGLVGIQLAHAGRKASTWPLYETNARGTVEEKDGGWPDAIVSSSPIAWDGEHAQPHELSEQQILEIVEAFKDAAVRTDKAGFDVVEIHAAHGYLAHGFLSPMSNKRTDKYGGSLENRARFLTLIVTAVRSVWPEHKPLFLRLSCTDWVEESSWNVDEVVQVVESLVALGVDVVDCSSGGAHTSQKIKSGPGFQVPFAEAVRQRVSGGVLTAAVGLITDPKQANAIVDEGRADFVMVGRQFLRDSWVNEAAEELDVHVGFINQYIYGRKGVHRE